MVLMIRMDPRHKHLDFRSEFGIIFGPEVNTMNITNDIKPVTYLKAKAADLLNQINETQRPVIIPKSYENMRNAIGLLKLVSQGEVDIQCGRTKPQKEMFDKLEGALKKDK
jgi:hypothetical protein